MQRIGIVEQMGRTPELPISVDENYRKLLRTAVAAHGGQTKVAELIDVDQGTISRTLATGGRATYTTLKKMSQKLDGVPPPVVAVRDQEHANWCVLGAELAEKAPGRFAKLLDDLRDQLALAAIQPDVAQIDSSKADRLKSVVTHPLPGRSKKSDRRG